jgi:hypothetical protein
MKKLFVVAGKFFLFAILARLLYNIFGIVGFKLVKWYFIIMGIILLKVTISDLGKTKEQKQQEETQNSNTDLSGAEQFFTVTKLNSSQALL